jgi:ketosteroid isomerase-like protein
MPEFERAEVEAAFQHFVAVGDSGDWDAWTDLHTEDGLWVEHHLGTQRGRDEIRRAITDVMKPVPMMEFPVAWHMIEGNRVVAFIWQVFPDPQGGSAEYRFGNVTVLEYAGDGLWSYQEDLYNPREAEGVVAAWLAAGGKLAAPLGGGE